MIYMLMVTFLPNQPCLHYVQVLGLKQGGSASAGDFNGDGYSDVLIGAYYDSVYPNTTGASYVILGHKSDYKFNDIDFRITSLRKNGLGFKVIWKRWYLFVFCVIVQFIKLIIIMIRWRYVIYSHDDNANFVCLKVMHG